MYCSILALLEWESQADKKLNVKHITLLLNVLLCSYFTLILTEISKVHLTARIKIKKKNN